MCLCKSNGDGNNRCDGYQHESRVLVDNNISGVLFFLQILVLNCAMNLVFEHYFFVKIAVRQGDLDGVE